MEEYDPKWLNIFSLSAVDGQKIENWFLALLKSIVIRNKANPKCPKLQWRLQQSELWQRAQWGGWKALKNILEENNDSFVSHRITRLSLLAHDKEGAVSNITHCCCSSGTETKLLWQSDAPEILSSPPMGSFYSLQRPYKKDFDIFCSGAEVICLAHVCNLNKSKAGISVKVVTR